MKDYTCLWYPIDMSVSGQELVLEIRDKTKTRCVLKRHLSPRTVGIILRSLPLEGNVHHMGKSIIYINVPLDSGTERPRDVFKQGDIAFLSSTGSICFFLDDVVSTKTMTPVGHINDVNLLCDVQAGDVLCIYAD